MKTHNYGPRLAILAAACSLAACTESPPGPPPATEAPPSTAPSSSVADASESAIVPGKYHVCHVEESAKVHNHLVGDHVPEGTPVFIRPIAAATGTTLFCIGETCPQDPTRADVQDAVFWMAGDEKRVQTVKEFAHKKSDPSTSAPPVAVPPVRHLVQLMKAQTPTDECQGKNVLMLRFCEWGEGEDGPTWLCSGDQPHAGVVHLSP
jgi:hypothetical protein